MSSEFVHLHLHTTYSLLDGANQIDAVCARAKALGMPGLAMTDHGNLSGAVEFLQAGAKHGLKTIVGLEAYVTPGSRHDRGASVDETTGGHADYNHLILLATNQTGYRNLCALSSRSFTEGFYYKPRIDHELLAQYQDGLIALSGCLRGEVPTAITSGNFDEARRIAGFYKQIFGDRYYFEVQANALEDQQQVNRSLRDFSVEMGIPLVATNDCHYLTQDDAVSHDILLCIQTGATISKPDRFKFSTTDLYLRTAEDMTRAFAEIPDALRNTVAIAERCELKYVKPTLQMPHYPVPAGETTDSMLRRLATAGLRHRLLTSHPAAPLATYEHRLQYELDVIGKLAYTGYFLILWDIIQWSRAKGIPVGPGRGSAAGSLVAYALGLTELDPLRHKLIFERFLNPDRVSPPDIDTDFCMDRRSEVIEYIKQRFGSDRVAQIITFGTLGAKAVVRDVARVLEHPYQVGDKLSKLIPQHVGMTLDKALEEEPKLQEELTKSVPLQTLWRHAKALEGLNRHASTHAAGLVISPGPMTDFVPLSKTATDDIVTQFSMEDLEAIGLVKFDFLGLRTLTVIDYAVRIIRQTQPEFTVPLTRLDDAKTFQLIQSGHTIGVFQLENHGMRSLLQRLHPTTFDDITAVIALYRPGPLESGMVNDYIDRKHGRLPIEYEFPELESILKDTYGTIVYQEQVIALSQTLCGMTAAQADLLRRAMGKKKPEEMAKTKAMFVEGAVNRGLPRAAIETLYDKIALFAGYSFNRSHSAAYALLTYQTAYLKTHFPSAYMTAVLTSEQSHPDKLARYLAECRRMGLTLLPPDVNISDRPFTHTPEGIRYGLSGIKHVGDNAVTAILATRATAPYTSLWDACSRLAGQPVNRRVWDSLIKTGACDRFGLPRTTLLEQIPIVLKGTNVKATAKARAKAEAAVQALTQAATPMTAGQQPVTRTTLDDEKNLLGVYVSGHPLDMHTEALARQPLVTSDSLPDQRDGLFASMAGVITVIRTSKTKKNDTMAFLTLEDAYGSYEAVVFPNLYRIHADDLLVGQAVILQGTLDVSEHRTSMKTQSIEFLLTPLPPDVSVPATDEDLDDPHHDDDCPVIA